MLRLSRNPADHLGERLSGETVADPRLGEDVLGLRRVGLDLLAQLIDEDAEVLGLVAVIGAPLRLQQLAMSYRAAGVRDEVAQSLEFLRREADIFSIRVDFARIEIDL